MGENVFLQDQLKNLPASPGIYKYLDKSGKLLYVGKAKNIRKRVGSYFIRQQDNFKTAELVRRIARVECTIVSSEQDALLLENALIKEHLPLFNIDLKDDKTYPYVVVKKEPFPRVFLTRKKIQDGSVYLGPFSSAGQVRELLELVREFIPLRTCRLSLTEKEINKKKYKVCLEYHLGNCKGPCEGLQSEESYEIDLQQVKNILRGRLSPVIQYLRIEQKKMIEALAFEKAAQLQKKVERLEDYQARSIVVNPSLGDLDTFAIIRHDSMAFIHYLMVRDGTIVRTESIQVECKLNETKEEVMETMLMRLREKYGSTAVECIVPFEPELLHHDLRITVPKSGSKRKLLDMAISNAEYAMKEFRRRESLHLRKKDDQEQAEVLHSLKEVLSLPAIPMHIECFDNSNFHGSFPVSAMVCFKNGQPSRADYRHYNIKTVEGINDFASMEEVVRRRYERLLKEGKALPQLVIIDGGKGQLAAAAKSIDTLGLSSQLTLIGLAKNVEEVFFRGDQESLKLPYQSAALGLLRQIRDEVHRFGIEFHRLKRSKGALHHEWEEIAGIGKKTIQVLLQHFRSNQGIVEAGLDTLIKKIGTEKATIMWDYVQKKGAR